MKDIEVVCSFCGKPQKQAKRLIANPTGDAYICDDCVRICADIIKEDAIKINDSTYAIKRKNNSDKGQRAFCGCMISKDIGEYSTCPHLCEYCYANTNKLSAKSNYKQHLNNSFSEDGK